MRAFCAMAVLATAFCNVLGGCGNYARAPSGGVDGGTLVPRGALNLVIQWPGPDPGAPGRVIPAVAQSVVVELFQAGVLVAGSPVTIARPQSSYRFTEVQALPTTIRASAYPAADGTGVTVAQGAVEVTVVAGQETQAPDLVMGSTVNQLSLIQDAVALMVGQAVTLLAEARDSSGSVVLLSPGVLRWDSSPSGVVTVEPDGPRTGAVVRAAAIGQATVTVADPDESGKTASSTITVTDAFGGADLQVGVPTTGSVEIGIGTPLPLFATGGAEVTMRGADPDRGRAEAEAPTRSGGHR